MSRYRYQSVEVQDLNDLTEDGIHIYIYIYRSRARGSIWETWQIRVRIIDTMKKYVRNLQCQYQMIWTDEWSRDCVSDDVKIILICFYVIWIWSSWIIRNSILMLSIFFARGVNDCERRVVKIYLNFQVERICILSARLIIIWYSIQNKFKSIIISSRVIWCKVYARTTRPTHKCRVISDRTFRMHRDPMKRILKIRSPHCIVIATTLLERTTRETLRMSQWAKRDMKFDDVFVPSFIENMRVSK